MLISLEGVDKTHCWNRHTLAWPSRWTQKLPQLSLRLYVKSRVLCLYGGPLCGVRPKPVRKEAASQGVAPTLFTPFAQQGLGRWAG